MSRYFFCMLLCATMVLEGMAQTRKTDSLKALVHAAKNDMGKLDAILALAEEYLNVNRDTFFVFAEEALLLGEKSPSKAKRGLARLAKANAYHRWGWVDSSLVLCDEVIDMDRPAGALDRAVYFKACRQKAMYLAGHGRYPEALELLHRLVKEAAWYGDSLTMAANLNTIGSITLFTASPLAAMRYIREAAALLGRDASQSAVQASIDVNMAEAYFKDGRYDSALHYTIMGADRFRQQENLHGLAMALQRQANSYRAMKDLKQAEAALMEMLQIRERTGDQSMFIDDKLALVDFYRETGQLHKAIAFCNASLQRGDAYAPDNRGGRVFMNRLSQRIPFLTVLADCYKRYGDHAAYARTLEELLVAKDSLSQWKQEEAIADVQTKYEVEKKDNTIIRQQLTISRKNNLMVMAGAGGVMLVAGGLIWYDRYRRKQRQQAARAIHQAEEHERERIAADLHDNLGSFAAAITSNIDVLRHGGGIEANNPIVQELHDNSLAMVAQLNDTIWAMDSDSASLTAISDRIKVHLDRLRRSYPGFRMEVVESIDADTVFSPVVAFNLFRMMQEATNNALRHSQGNTLAVHITGAVRWEVVVSDNGIGIAGADGRKGNGIRNQQLRADRSGLSITFTTHDPQGTRVVIRPAETTE